MSESEALGPLTYLEAQEAARDLYGIFAAAAPPGVEVAQPTLNRIGSEWFAEVRVRCPIGEVARA